MRELRVKRIAKLLQSLTGRLILGVGLVILCFGITFSLLLFNYEKGILIDNLRSNAGFASELVMRAIHHGMLTNQPEEITETLGEMGRTEGVRSIHVIGPDGRIAFSSAAGMAGAEMDVDAGIDKAFGGLESMPGPFEGPDGATVLRYLIPVRNEPACFSAACHYHPSGVGVLGVLETTMSAERFPASIRRLTIGTVMYGTIFSLIVFSAIFIIIYRFVTRPMALMTHGMKNLASGDFDHAIPITTKDEIGLLASTFNNMALDIKTYKRKLEAWAGELQAEVDKKTREITEAHEQMVGAEKLASLGRMAAGVAHELNNPLTGVLTFAHLLKGRIPPEQTEDHEDLDAIIEQTERCAKIIRGLLGFARKTSSERMLINLSELIESSVSILRSQSKFRDVKISSQYAPGLPQALVDSNQIQQVILNIIQNAVDAMDDRGEVRIATRAFKGPDDREFVEAEFTDTGPGIMPDHLGRIFEPFFTTKPVGKGTGLGLPVSYGIVKRHGGEILVRSTVGKGTTFRVILPVDGAPEIVSAAEIA